MLAWKVGQVWESLLWNSKLGLLVTQETLVVII